MTFDGIIFDLDGTLTDSAPGLLTSLRGMHLDMGWAVPSDAELRAWMGPPVRATLLDLGYDEPTVVRAIESFRTHLREGGGLVQSDLYPGIAALLAELRARGVPVALATFKKQRDAETVIDHFGLRDYFAGVHGSLVDTNGHSKAAVIERAVASLGLPEGASIVMVGDRLHDVESAKELGLPAIGLAHGYAGEGELVRAGAIAVVDDVPALRAVLLDDPQPVV